MYGKSNIETYNTICKIYSQWEFSVWFRELKQGLCHRALRVGCRERWEGGLGGRGYRRMEKNCKKAKWLSGEALQTAMKRREAKGNGEKERYTHLNAEFQRVARRDKKAFLSYQCKEIEENNKMGKTSDPFKKISDTKETFHAIGHNKGQKWYGPNRSRRY